MTEKEYKNAIKTVFRQTLIDYIQDGVFIEDFLDRWQGDAQPPHLSDFEDEQGFILDKTLTKEIEKMVDKLQKA